MRVNPGIGVLFLFTTTAPGVEQVPAKVETMVPVFAE